MHAPARWTNRGSPIAPTSKVDCLLVTSNSTSTKYYMRTRLRLHSSSTAGSFIIFLATMTPRRHLISLALKGKLSAKGERAPRMPSIADEFCRRPSPVFAVGIAVLSACPLVLAAARAPHAAIDEGVRNGSRLATTPDGPPGVETAALWPRCDERARLSHV